HARHADMEMGIIEFLPVADGPSNLRRIVSTGFRNPAMPFIRYDLGDLAVLSERGECRCGYAAPLVERIDGRIDAYIITPDGRRLGRLGFVFKGSDTIREAQFVQDAPDHVLVNVMRSARYNGADEAALVRNLGAYVGPEMKIDVAYPREIPREPNGKFRVIVSKIPGLARELGGSRGASLAQRGRDG
ncbi:MAG: hypothetical protein KKB50_13585, partial [Planctomycetes bacterium]|nr:hypothetical protein [Planctomycetota bacterium]